MTACALPHERVHVRLGCSAIHGVGVFAGEDIAAGTNVFATDTLPMRWIDEAELARLPMSDFHRRFYRDFAVRRGDRLGCPADFNLLTVGWYVNQPAEGQLPNLVPSPDFDLIAARDIRRGEELTLDYASFGRAAV